MRRTALVTGAGRGIGRSIVEALAPDAWVASLDIQFDDDPAGDREYNVDVSDSAAVDDAISAIVAERGGIDWVVCAAGIVRDRVSWKMSDAEWEEVLGVNLTGAFNVTRAATPFLRPSDGGRVVFVSSINGVRGSFGQANYAAAKAGMIGLSKTLARELARDGVTVNCILPGYIDTAMTRALTDEVRAAAIARTPLGRLGEVEDISAAVHFLCGDSAGFITGAAIPVDGGQLMGGQG